MTEIEPEILSILAAKSKEISALTICNMFDATDKVKQALVRMVCDIITLKPSNITKLILDYDYFSVEEGDKIRQALI